MKYVLYNHFEMINHQHFFDCLTSKIGAETQGQKNVSTFMMI